MVLCMTLECAYHKWSTKFFDWKGTVKRHLELFYLNYRPYFFMKGTLNP